MASGINITDKTHGEISDFAYDHRVSMKELTERIWTYIKKHREEFDEEMF